MEWIHHLVYSHEARAWLLSHLDIRHSFAPKARKSDEISKSFGWCMVDVFVQRFQVCLPLAYDSGHVDIPTRHDSTLGVDIRCVFTTHNPLAPASGLRKQVPVPTVRVVKAAAPG